MKSTFHELQLDQVAIRNATKLGTEELTVTLKPGSRPLFQFEIKQGADEDDQAGETASLISIDQHGLTELFKWLKETGALQ